MSDIRRAERAVVRALRDAGFGSQSQVTWEDRFEIATDDLVVKVWTVDAYDRQRVAVDRAELEAELERERTPAPCRIAHAFERELEALDLFEAVCAERDELLARLRGQ